MKKLFFLLAIFFFSACNQEETLNEQAAMAKFIESYALSLPEPSGLTLSYDKTFLWTVSDNNSTVYKISIHGTILASFEVDGKDLEGITVVDDTTLAIAKESKRTILFVTTEGKELKRKRLDGIKGNDNSGIEGITYNPSNGHFFMVNEKNPTLLIETDNDLNIIKKKELDIASDLSGIFYEPTDSSL